MKVKEKIKVGITIGDLNGIGGEIILKTFEDSRMLDFCTPVIYASVKTMSHLKKHFGFNVNFNGINTIDKVVHGKLNVFNAWNEKVNIEFGKESPKAGELAIKSLKLAVQHLKEGAIDTLVTAPINKHNIQSNEFQFPGHTDYLAQELEGNSLMFMVTDALKVGLLTDHVPVKEVTNHITAKRIQEKLHIIHKSLQQDFKVRKPKIAVLGINPHIGDNGVIGKEDDEVLRPTLEALREKGMLVFGPYAADSFFGSNNYKNFDAIVASYHDQGLIPFKTLSFGNGVNYTAGLNKVRTSPDHGTAYEIAGKGEADENSFKQAVFTAIKIFKNREEHQALTENPLKTNQKKI
ncbi:4-hydroxythreonine-4-phosphate dehydrogenase [Mangrovimonas yunxiaonensis]|uniref:4-hydroxythreonine-4-phosphate dehydrogenase n=1 Tax=Mangrovimonas yunxiaonensis TaxID=1197477 RepID=A0A084TKS1_9FLAO|nr:4-hydroxythreonine-4-phosphate dehydrogenase PdxA [Mangrovimonas yunxiaonensis]KFB01307.1 4-hydroxythreonine-4-phosphate dehydrogenase [Mangrovimonas yunxiaonensis]GGH37465.1 4-hydroxythreonine-4-phosphate dehydrogenase [Mangrovimonas yunxiaonensis]